MGKYGVSQGGRRRRGMALLLAVSLCAAVLAGCGDGITEETKQLVTKKTDEAMSLYADLEKLVQENELEVEQAFTDMKQQLTDMSEKVKSQVGETTEEDGKKAVEALDKMIENLKAVKDKVEKSLE